MSNANSHSDESQSLDDKIGIRKNSRFLPVVVLIVTAIFFVAAIKDWRSQIYFENGEQAKAVSPIQVKNQTLNQALLTEVDLTANIFGEDKDHFKITKCEVSQGGEALINQDQKSIIVRKDPDNENEIVVVNYEFQLGDSAPQLAQWRGHPKYWELSLHALQGSNDSLAAWEDYGQSQAMVSDFFKNLGKSILYLSRPLAGAFAFDLPKALKFMLALALTVSLFAIPVGLAGMFYRRSFIKYFAAAAIIFLVIDITYQMLNVGSVALHHKEALIIPYSFYQWLVVGFVMIFLIMRVRFHNLFRGPLAGIHEKFFPGKANPPRKNIVVCLDGSWNHPGQKDHGYLAQTNVFKLFNMLKGKPLGSKKLVRRYSANLVKSYQNPDDPTHRQIALYYNGVGNKVENSGFGQAFGGAFGLGAEAIKERAYTDIVKEYNKGDRIYIFGFSRGAAIARLVAGELGRRGIPRSLVTLRFLGQIRPFLKLFGNHTRYEPGNPPTEGFKVNVLGCWDTVGAFGISKNILGIPFQKINLLKNLTIGDHVERAYHMVALDETRDAFEPTLMDEDPTNPERVVEVWFSGNHSNVGGGFHTDKLSNGALAFLLEHISSGYCHSKNKDAEGKIRPMGDETWGIYLNAINWLEAKTNPQMPLDPSREPQPHEKLFPDPLGKLRISRGDIYQHNPRVVAQDGIIHDSVIERMEHEEIGYAPESVFKLCEEIANSKSTLAEKVKRLSEIKVLEPGQQEKLTKWLDDRMTIRRWSQVNQEQNPEIEKRLSNQVTV